MLNHFPKLNLTYFENIILQLLKYLYLVEFRFMLPDENYDSFDQPTIITWENSLVLFTTKLLGLTNSSEIMLLWTRIQ